MRLWSWGVDGGVRCVPWVLDLTAGPRAMLRACQGLRLVVSVPKMARCKTRAMQNKGETRRCHGDCMGNGATGRGGCKGTA
jgi:hypothetical protein